MNEKFLKARIPGDLYADLLARSGAEGKRLGTFVRDVPARVKLLVASFMQPMAEYFGNARPL